MLLVDSTNEQQPQSKSTTDILNQAREDLDAPCFCRFLIHLFFPAVGTLLCRFFRNLVHLILFNSNTNVDSMELKDCFVNGIKTFDGESTDRHNLLRALKIIRTVTDGCVVISLSALIQFVWTNRLKWNFCKVLCGNIEAKLTDKVDFTGLDVYTQVARERYFVSELERRVFNITKDSDNY